MNNQTFQIFESNQHYQPWNNLSTLLFVTRPSTLPGVFSTLLPAFSVLTVTYTHSVCPVLAALPRAVFGALPRTSLVVGGQYRH